MYGPTTASPEISQKHSEALFHAIIDSAPDVIILVNDEGGIELVNKKVISLFGYRHDELIGKSVELLIPDWFRAIHVGHRQEFLESPEVRSMGEGFELYGRKKNRDEFPIDVNLSPLAFDEKNYVLAAVRDISEHIVIEKQLRQAKNVAEKATTTKTRFLAAASHDLRQPLQSLGMYLAVLSRLDHDTKCQEIYGKIDKAFYNVNTILDALLDISMLESGSITPLKRDFSLQELFENIQADLIPRAEEKGLEFRVASTNCVVHTDFSLLQRVLENLASNAVNYTKSGHVELSCECLDDYAHIKVKDTGIGIPPESIKKIFEEYYQLDNEARTHNKGLGLGLSIVKHISSLLDHRLEITSTLDKGTIFTVHVPISKNAPQQIQVQENISTENKGLISVLLIDDDDLVLDAILMLLESEGFQVHTAMNGDEAYTLLSGISAPSIIVSDYRLPKQKGTEVVQRLRGLMNNEIPAIILTGDTSAIEIANAKLDNCKVLHKPADTEKLINVIYEMTD